MTQRHFAERLQQNRARTSLPSHPRMGQTKSRPTPELLGSTSERWNTSVARWKPSSATSFARA